jgi:hypothetical protein
MRNLHPRQPVVEKIRVVIIPRGQMKKNVLGPVPGVDVMAKRSQGLLNVGTLSRGLLAVLGLIWGSRARGRGGGGGGV